MSEKEVGDLLESCIPYLSSSLSKNDETFFDIAIRSSRKCTMHMVNITIISIIINSTILF